MTYDVPTHRPTALSARVAVLATAALAAVFGLPALSSADAVEGSAVAEPGNGVTGGVPARVALRRAEAAVNPDPGAEPARDATIALRDLALAFPRLEGADRRAARGLLARPTDKNDPQRDSYKTAEAAPVCSANFCVHYVAGTGDAPNLADVAPANGVPDYVEQISAAAETSFAVENGTLGWPDAKSDGSLGGGEGLVDIYLVDIGDDGLFGYAAPDPPPSQRCGRKCFAYLVLDNDYAPDEFNYPDPGIPLRVTMAHEYNHVLQFNLDAIQDGWLFESTATWAEEKVFPNDNDYVNYLRKFARTPSTSITNFNGAGGLKIYGLATFQHWLDTGAGNFGPSVNLGNWTLSTKTRPKDFAVASVDASIRQRGGKGFAQEFSEFAAASAEWKTAGPFPDAAAYPDVKRKGGLKPGGSTNLVLDHTAYQLLNVSTGGASSVTLRVKGERGVTTGVALVGRDDQTATVTTQLRLLKKGGKGTVTLPNAANFERITAVIVNADGTTVGFSQADGDWVYSKDNIPFTATLTK